MATKAVSVKLSDAERERLAQLAQKKRRSSHFLMREALLDFLEREEKRLDFVRDAEEAWTDYMESGAHITLDDLADWNQSRPAPLPPWRRS